MRVSANSRSSTKLISRIDVDSFASVLIVLIAVALLSAMSVGVPFHSNLPRVSHPAIILGLSRPDAIVISVFRNGEVWYGKEQITTAEVS
jgi:biopolymer transport protein ExbD